MCPNFINFAVRGVMGCIVDPFFRVEADIEILALNGAQIINGIINVIDILCVMRETMHFLSIRKRNKSLLNAFYCINALRRPAMLLSSPRLSASSAPDLINDWKTWDYIILL